MFDLKTRVCGVWAYEVQRLPYWWVATPFRLQFSWIADTYDGELVHSAAVCHGDSGILLTGVSGSGKSTLTHQLAEEGFDTISDDFVLVEEEIISSPYLRTKLHDSSLDLVPNLRQKILNRSEHGQKRILHGIIPEDNRSARLRHILLVRLEGKSSVNAVEAKQVFEELAVGTIPGVLGGSVRSLSRIASIVRHSQVARFASSPDLADNLETWGRFVNENR